MPFIAVQSLPFRQTLPVSQILASVTSDFANATGIDANYVTATWQFYAPDHYVSGGQGAGYQPDDSHPLLVQLLCPDFHSSASVEIMLRAIASSLSRHTGVPARNVFVHHAAARSGSVFDQGDIRRW